MPASKTGVWKNPQHGTVTGYSNYGCRCDPCRAANAAEQFEAMLSAQGGVCAICQAGEGVLQVDHDHSCCAGQRSCGSCVRGLLCAKCNTAVAFFGDDPARIRRAIAYLTTSSLGGSL